MRTRVFNADTLVSLLQEQKVATMEQMKRALGTNVEMTVFRRLREIGYFSSYSHSGKYYALKSVARFDKRGLWTRQRVHFSKYGSLVDTAEHVIVDSAEGFSASELDAELQVETKGALLNLFRRGRLARETVSGLYVYCSPEAKRRREQLFGRSLAEGRGSPAGVGAATQLNEETRAAIVLFFSMLDERQRRLYAGLESVRLGRGGDRRMSELTGMDVHTVAKGREELLSGRVASGRLRRPGGGRKALEKKRQQ